MISIIRWLGRNKLIAILLGLAVYFSIVTFHDEITQLAIKLRNAIGRDQYNASLGYGFLILLLIFLAFFAWHIYRGKQKLPMLVLIRAIIRMGIPPTS